LCSLSKEAEEEVVEEAEEEAVVRQVELHHRQDQVKAVVVPVVKALELQVKHLQLLRLQLKKAHILLPQLLQKQVIVPHRIHTMAR
jgi:hypothetical protein